MFEATVVRFRFLDSQSRQENYGVRLGGVTPEQIIQPKLKKSLPVLSSTQNEL